MNQPKSLLVLGRRDHTEAMRVAAGLTIFGHTVHLVFMTAPVEVTEENAAQAELLELSDIVPHTTVKGQDIDYIDSSELAMAIINADAVLNV